MFQIITKVTLFNIREIFCIKGTMQYFSTDCVDSTYLKKQGKS